MAKNVKNTLNKTGRVLNVRRDSIDFRDRMYVPTLVEVPTIRDLKEYQKIKAPVLDQGSEGACTGFGLAAVVNYLLRTRKQVPSKTEVSPDMLYRLARRYDEWPGENYEGSSARGAMKGWHKHGVCSTTVWNAEKGRLTPRVADEALINPLGAYFRVNHKDLVAMHCAITETGILYATANVHEGWEQVDKKGIIPLKEQMLGGHAFAIVAYDDRGFWIQNSWGGSWGKDGFACITYDDWLANGNDVWVARLGVPVQTVSAASAAVQYSGLVPRSSAASNNELRSHIISLGNDGLLKRDGTFGNDSDDVAEIMGGCAGKKIVLYAHGGLTAEDSAVQVLADFLPVFREAGVYPVSFIWHSDFWTTLLNILRESLGKRRPEGFLDSAKDFMLDRLDDALEPIARVAGGKAQWDEMKENALGATLEKEGGARQVAHHLQKLVKQGAEIHLIGHSAGSIFHAPLVQLLASNGTIKSGPMKGAEGLGVPVSSCTLWAPACTIDLFKKTYLPLIGNGIERFALFALDDKTEQDDNCARIYNKSLLYLVSNAFESEPRIPLFRDGFPILGMEKFIRQDADLKALFRKKNVELILSPNSYSDKPADYSTSRHHGDFDNDKATVMATLQRITGTQAVAKLFKSRKSTDMLRRQRCLLQR
ncbi:MAG: C1 family peptidase [Deltaproteobacteria bacterium]|nr:C1 family peptidase [Deltaproteobacteria bacterium]